MTAFTFSTLFVSIGSFILALFVYSRGRQSIINVTWALFSASVGIWSLGYFGFLLSDSKSEAFFWIRILYCGAIFIPTLCFHFICVLLRCYEEKKKLITASYALSAFFEIANLTPYFVKDLQPILNFKWWPVPGICFGCFVAHFILMLSYGIYLIAKNYRTASFRQRNQTLYLVLGIGIAFIGGSTNYLSIYGLPVFPFGNLFVIALPALVVYAIVKHQLMDISVIIRKTLVFAGISFFVFACFSIPLFLIPNIFPDAGSGRLKWWLLALTGMAVASLVGPLNQFLVNVTDKYLFQKKTNYRVLLREATEYLAHVASLRSLARTIVAFFLKKARLTNASIYAFTSRGSIALSLAASRPAVEDPELKRIDLSHPIINFFSHHQGPIQIDTLKELNKTKGFLKPEEIEKIMGLMNSLKAEAAVPCLGGKVAARLEKMDVYLKAILFLGHQKSDEPYSEEDLDVFFTLGQESSIAFENARLYDEVVERTKMLEQTNMDLSDANEKLKVTQASLIVAEKNATMVGMAKAIGHEVNNPLSTVAGRATWIYRDNLPAFKDILNDDPEAISPEQLRKMKKAYSNIDNDARKIEHSAKRIEVVVKTLTDILKDTKGEISPLSLLVLFREAREATRFVTYEENLSGCQIKEDIASNLIIMGNLEQLLQVFVNLIKNAYEAMGKQPNRLIIVRGHPDPDDAAMAKIEVEDNGPGMPPEVLTNIWKQGFSTKVRTSDQIGAAGQGQGLFICKHMIESVHSGSILAKSIPGQGTTFIIKLPLADLGG